jgi:hypothetical protein
MIDKNCNKTNKPMAMGMPINIRYKTDITQAKTLIINYQQNIRE